MADCTQLERREGNVTAELRCKPGRRRTANPVTKVLVTRPHEDERSGLLTQEKREPALAYRSYESAGNIHESQPQPERDMTHIRSCPTVIRQRDSTPLDSLDLSRSPHGTPDSSSNSQTRLSRTSSSSFRFTVVDPNSRTGVRTAEDSEELHSAPKEKTILFMLKTHQLDTAEGHKPLQRRLGQDQSLVALMCCCFQWSKVVTGF
uniref:Uncharacterized protein n=1 Tax=Lotharella oceanica TaxID=641309 RepID=A0A7S2X8T6_9EUKA|mmetsp:Transcript_16873/g.31956  ORF Transcript_16873/g.31956 Transcript_16873/m.31956 type:complete len:205 (+) Transcript_16873:1-615(+)